MVCPVVTKILAEHFGKDEVNEQDELIRDLGGDQLDVIELVMTLEEKFNILISDDDAENLHTVRDVCECVASKQSEYSVA